MKKIANNNATILDMAINVQTRLGHVYTLGHAWIRIDMFWTHLDIKLEHFADGHFWRRLNVPK